MVILFFVITITVIILFLSALFVNDYLYNDCIFNNDYGVAAFTNKKGEKKGLQYFIFFLMSI